MEPIENLSFRIRASYSMGHVLNDVFASLWFSYLLVYFQVVLNAGPVRAGVLMLIGQIADGLATPFVGYHSDTSPPSKYGRRKSWHLFGSFCVAASFPFIFSPCLGCSHTSMDAQMVYYAAFIVIFQIGWASVQVSHLALIPELTNDRQQRTQLTALRYTFTVLSNVGVYLVTWLVLHISDDSSNQIGPDDVGKFQHVVWVGLAVGILCTILFHCFLKEPVRVALLPGQTQVTHSTILKKFAFYRVALVYMCTRLSVNLSQSLLPLYLHMTLQLPRTALASIPLTCFLSSLIGSFSVQSISRLSERRLAYTLGALPIIGSCVWIFLGSGENFKNYEIYVLAVLLGGGGAVILVTSLGLTADLIGTATHTSALVYGAMSFTDKLANGLAVMLIQRLSVEIDGAVFYRWALAIGCGVPALLATLTLLPPMPESAECVLNDDVEERTILPDAEECEPHDNKLENSTAE